LAGRFHQSVLTVRDQLAWVKLFHPTFSGRVCGGTLICTGKIQPAPLNRVYEVEIRYSYLRPPMARVREPKLRRRKQDERIPHTYSDDIPCLYLPGKGDWRPDKKIALTIIPWLSLWLFYYESWLATGQWQGGGVHPFPTSVETVESE
jgi:hypothetical protein